MPESPKFLMTTGNNEAALDVFRKVYRFNTGNSPETFPVRKSQQNYYHFNYDFIITRLLIMSAQ
jgi:hypothetical protein